MNTQNKKIAAACFAGAAVCGALLAILSPAFAWLGFVAGACVGYVGYELREFLAAVPVASRRAADVVGAAFASWWRDRSQDLAKVVAYFKQGIFGPRPIFKLSLAAAFLAAWVAFEFFPSDAEGGLFSKAVVIMGGAFGAFFLSVLSLNVLTGLGQRWKHEYVVSWGRHVCTYSPLECMDEDDRWAPVNYAGYLRQRIDESGYRVAEPTVRNVVRWVAFSPLVALCGTWGAVSTFSVSMFILVHKTERSVCAVDSVIGGALGWWMFRGDPSAPVALVAACCGAIGAAVGIVHSRMVASVVSRLPAATA